MARGVFKRGVIVVGRVLGWGLLGAVSGRLLGLTIGFSLAPPDVPGQPLANEWYTVGVLLIMFVEGIAGVLVGAGIAVGAGSSPVRREVFVLALGGAALGVGLGWIFARVFHVVLVDWRDGSELVSSLVLQAAGAVGGVVFAAMRRADA